MVVNVIENPTQAEADDLTLCPATIPESTNLSANTPTIGSGTWTLLSQPSGSGPVTITFPNDPNTNVDGLEYGVYEFEWTTENNGCTTSDVATVTLSEPPSAADVSASATEFCQFDDVFLQGNIPTNGTPQWRFTSKPAGAPDPLILDPNEPLTQVIVTVTGTYTFEYRISAPGCPDEVDVLNITLFEEPGIAAISSGNQDVCETDLPYAISGSAPQPGETVSWRSIPALSDGTATFSPNNAANTDITSFSVVSGSSTYAIEYTISTGSPLCDSRDTVFLTVWEEPTTASTDPDYEDCAATTLNLDANTPTVGTGGWARISGPNAPAVADASSPNTTISTTVPGTYVYRWTISNGPACSASFNDLTITNFEEIGSDGDNPITVCDGASPTLEAQATGGNGNYTYVWEVSTGDCTGPWSPISGETIDTYTTPTLSSATGSYFYRVIISDDGPCTDFTSDCITVTVVDDPNITDQPDNVDICSGGTANFNVTASGGTPSLTYQWQYNDGFSFVNVSNGIPAGATYSGATTASLTVNTTNATPAGITEYRVLVNASGLNCDEAISSTVQMEVFEDPDIDVQPTGSEICEGETETLDVTASGTAPSGSLLLQWEFRSPTGSGSWANAPGTSTDPTYTTPALTADTEYRVVVTQPESGCETISDEVTVQVNPIPQVTSSATDLVCNGDDLNYSITSDVAGTTFTWTAAVLTSPAGGILGGFSGGSGATINQTLTNTGDEDGVIRYTITPTGPGPTNCVGADFTLDVTVEPTPEVNATNNAAVICDGDDTDIDLDNDGVSGSVATTYSWTAAETTSPDGGAFTGFSAGSGNSINQTLSNSGTSQGVVTYTITPSIGACDGSAITVNVIVNPSAQVDEPADEIYCDEAAVPQLDFTTDRTDGTTTYSWTNDNTSIGLAASGSDAFVPAFTAANTSTSPIFGDITITPSYENGGLTCSGDDETYRITVNPQGQVNNPGAQAICNDEATTIAFTTNNSGGTTTYDWTNDNPSIGLAASGTGDISFTGTNTGTSPIEGVITVTPTFSNGGVDCVGDAQIFEITVNPLGQVNAIANQRVCNGDPTTTIPFSTVNTGGTTTYSWTVSDPSIGLADGSGTEIPSFTAINTGTTEAISTITVTPSFEGCDGPTEEFTITVDPTPTVTSESELTICSGQSVNYSPTANIPGTTFSWTATNTIGTVTGFSPTGTGDINDVLTNQGPADGAVTYVITPEGPGPSACDGLPFSLVVEVVNCNPIIGIAKQLTSLTNNFDGTATAIFSYKLENYGNTVLTDVTLEDNLDDAFGAGNYTINSLTSGDFSVNPGYDGSPVNAEMLAISGNTLNVGESGLVSLSVDILSPGNYTNSATVTGDSPDGPITDTSEDGPDPNPSDSGDPRDDNEPTPLDFDLNPLIGLAKNLSGLENNGDGSWDVSYEFVVRNYGDVNLTAVNVTDDLTSTFPAPCDLEIVSLTSSNLSINVNYNGVSDTDLLSTPPSGTTNTLDVGEEKNIQLTVRVDECATSGIFNNNSNASGDDPEGTTVNDDSQNGTDPDPDGDGDPTNDDSSTPVEFIEEPFLGLAKRLLAPPVNNGDGSYTFSFEFRIVNRGNVQINDLSLMDDLELVFGGDCSFSIVDISSEKFAVNAGYDGLTAGDTEMLASGNDLDVNDVGAVELEIIAGPCSGFGPFDNTASVSGDTPQGDLVSDDSQDGSEPDPAGSGDPTTQNDPTPFSFSESPLIASSKQLVSTTDIGDGTYDVLFNIRIENQGDVDLTSVMATDDLVTAFGAGNFEVASLTSSEFTVNLAFDGGANQNLLVAGNDLLVGEVGLVFLTVTVLSPGSYTNQASVSGTSPSGATTTDDSHDGTEPDPLNSDPTPVELDCTVVVECPQAFQGTYACDSDIPAAVTTEAEFNARFGANSIANFCSGDVTLSVSDATTGTGCAGDPLELTRTYTISHPEVADIICEVFYIVEDTETPLISSPPSDLILECGDAGNAALISTWEMNNGNASFSDICDGSPVVSFSAGTSISTCGGTTTTLYTLTVADACGNTQEAFANLTFVDTQEPLISLPTISNTAECDGDISAALNAWFADASATDNCNASVDVVPSLISKITQCNGTNTEEVRTYQFFASDDCGNSAIATADFIIEDSNPPVITAPADLVVDCETLQLGGQAGEISLWLSEYTVT